MMVASMEAALELWASSLRDIKGRIRPLFTQERVAQSAGLFLDGLLGPERRKTGWMRAEAAGGVARQSKPCRSDNQRHIHWWNISEVGSWLSSPKPPSAVA